MTLDLEERKRRNNRQKSTIKLDMPGVKHKKCKLEVEIYMNKKSSRQPLYDGQ